MKKLSNSVSVSELMHMREEMGMTNKQIAERLGISYMTVKRYIGNQPEGMRAAPKRKDKPLPPVDVEVVEPAPVLSFTERLAAMRPVESCETFESIKEAAEEARKNWPKLAGVAPGEVEVVAELDMPSAAETTKNDVINHPKHYTREGAMESIDEMLLIFGKEAVMSFCVCNAWKYRYRAAMKNGEEDIKKSDWYMAKYKELKEME